MLLSFLYHFLWQSVPCTHHAMCDKTVPQVPYKPFPSHFKPMTTSFRLFYPEEKTVVVHHICAPYYFININNPSLPGQKTQPILHSLVYHTLQPHNILINHFCLLSSLITFFLQQGNQKCTQYLKCGHAKVLYSFNMMSPVQRRQVCQTPSSPPPCHLHGIIYLNSNVCYAIVHKALLFTV